MRHKIDALDVKLVRLLNRRAKLVHQIGEYKRKHRLPVRDSKRERFVLDHAAKLNPGPLSDSAIRQMLAMLIDEFRKFEESHVHGRRPVIDGRRKTLAIIGLGLMGASFARAVREFAPGYRLVGFDVCLRNKSAKKTLQRLNLVDQLASSPQEALRANVVVLAMPVRSIVEFLRKYRNSFSPHSIILDLGSTKELICAVAKRALPKNVVFIGGHPLAGKTASGLQGAQAAEATLFNGRPFVLVTTASKLHRKALSEVLTLVRAIGAIPVRMQAREHDRVLAATSHLPQMTSVALTLAVRRFLGARTRLLSGPAFRDMTRLATSDYKMWQDIAQSNSKQLDAAMNTLMQVLKALERAVVRGRFKKEFTTAKRYREVNQSC